MTRQQMLEMKKGFAELQAFELAEKIAASPATRMRQLDAIWLIAAELGVNTNKESGTTDQWAKLRKAIL